MLHTIRHKLALIGILLLAFVMRLYGLNWDSGYHFHPDERMLIMVADRVHLFSQMNPDFYNYGSLPIYILKGVSQILEFITRNPIANYDGMLYVGRYLSLINDLFVIVLIYLIALELFKKKTIALISALLYSLSFFPIQNTHFFISDTFINLFATLLLYLLLRYIHKPSFKKLLLISITFAAAITTKVTALVFVPVIALVLLIPLLHSRSMKTVSHFFVSGIIFSIVSTIFAFLFMPYAFINWQRFYTDISLQLQMNNDPYVFPYTLQYVGTLPYLYYIKNIAMWGVGPFIFGLFIIGLLEQGISIKIKHIWSHFKKSDKTLLSFILFYLFYTIYFVVAGKSAVKFMRYMLMIYPFIAIIAGYGFYQAKESLSGKSQRIFSVTLWILICIWTYAFLNIYSQKSTRIRATEWINENIPAGSVLAVEHWDDRVPIFDPGRYAYEEMTLYERPDDEMKWRGLNEKLARTDYIVIASNRLYTPLQKLEDCGKYKYCYPKTSEYYKKLFGGELNFEKVAEFTSYPTIRIMKWNIEIVDDIADESFTVYDHPKILIFKKNSW